MRLIPFLISGLRLTAMFLPLASALVWFQLENSVSFAFERICREITPADVGWLARSIGAAAGAGHLALLSWALIAFTSFVKDGHHKAYLSAKAVRSFRRFSILFLIYIVTTPLMNVLASQVLTKGVAITINTDDIKLLGCSVVLLAVSYILSVAQIAKNENEHFL